MTPHKERGPGARLGRSTASGAPLNLHSFCRALPRPLLGSLEGGQLLGQGREFQITLLDQFLQRGALSRHPQLFNPLLLQEPLCLSSFPLGDLPLAPLPSNLGRKLIISNQRLLQVVGGLGQPMLQ